MFEMITREKDTKYDCQWTQEYSCKQNWETLPHPAYSPDTNPPDYDLFLKLKQPLRGTRCSDLDDLQAALNTVVKDIYKGCLISHIRTLPKWSQRERHIAQSVQRLPEALGRRA